jgi:PPM family protein phosphatase
MKKVQAAASTSTGRVRTGNEDSFGCRTDYGIYVVCDGMGGAAGGEVASRMTVETLLRRMTEGEGEGFQERRERLQAAIAEANRAVLERADRDPGLSGMGTTLVALLLDSPAGPQRALVTHAGDSRCYRMRSGKLERITQDHSLVDEQIRLGNMTAEEAERSPFRSVITRAIGTQPSVNEESLELAVEAGDRFLLCSDGLTREVSEETIAQILGDGEDLERTAGALVDAANEHGGRDNVTCVVVAIRD